MKKYVVIAQDRSIFNKFIAALGIEPMKITSALAAKTLLQDTDNVDLVVIDTDVKDSDSVVKLVKRLNLPLIRIGEDVHKPLTEDIIIKAVNTMTAPEKADGLNPDTNLENPKEDEVSKTIIQNDILPENEEVHNEMLKELDEIWESGKEKTGIDKARKPEQKVDKSGDTEELISRIKKEVLNQIKEETGKTGGAQDAAKLNERAPKEPKVKIARQLVAAVWSAKPGIGKTFVAVNMGCIYAQAGLKTIIVDGDIFNLSVGIHLNLMDPNRTIEKALKESNVLKIKDYVLKHPKIPNLDILSGSEICRPENYTGFPEGSMAKLINTLRENYDVIIIDTATDPAVMTTYEALKAANKVIAVLSLDHAVTFNTKKYLNLLRKIRIIDKKFRYILNKDFPSSKVNKDVVEKALGVKIKHAIPNLYDKVTESIFESKPIMLYNTPATQQVRDALSKLASDIYPLIEKKPAKQKVSFFRKLFKRGESS